MKGKGCIHVYCGDGKGKTTAAVGLAVRAAGRGKKVLITRFLKTDDSGEVPVLLSIPGITVLPCEKSFGFYVQMSPEERKEAGEYYTGLFLKAIKQGAEGNMDLMVFDEIMAACRYELVKKEALLTFLENRNPGMEVVLTGRDPFGRLLDMADYVSEIKKVKHPFDKGLNARQGIEY